MYVVIRSDNVNGDVLGILDESTVRDPTDMSIESYSYAIYGCFGRLVMDKDLMHIIEVDLGTDNWRWEKITQAEYETYRDLHGFEVIK